MLRFRTRDITVLDDSPCPCGRTHIRMKKVMGRSDDMLIIRGVNVFPSQIEAVLMKTETLSPFYQIEVFRKGFVDSLRINVEASPPLYGKGADFMEKLAAKVKKDLKDYIGLTCEVAIRPTGAVERAMGKAIHVIDYRSSS
jgi:phenylacetate-CoA ligase